MQSLATLLHDHRNTLLQQDQQAASLERKATGPTIETEIVDAQLEGVEWDEDCTKEVRDDS